MAKQTPEECFYCGANINKRTNKRGGDHFPIPEICGGELTVPCCESCHDMKDRYNIGTWPTEWIGEVMKDFHSFRRETKLFMAKMMSSYLRGLNG
jgi:hypothetical protein